VSSHSSYCRIPEAANSADVRIAYVKAASEQAALLLDRQLTSEAGQTYEIAIQLGFLQSQSFRLREVAYPRCGKCAENRASEPTVP